MIIPVSYGIFETLKNNDSIRAAELVGIPVPGHNRICACAGLETLHEDLV